MKTRFLWVTAIVLVLLSLPGLVLAQPPTSPSAEVPGGGPGVTPPASPEVLWDQPSANNWGLASQYLSESGRGFYSADDFSNAVPWNIESIFVEGWQYYGNLTDADSLHWLVYPDAAGVPAGYPGAGGELWSFTCLPNDPAVTIGGPYSGSFTLDILKAQGAPLYLPPGTYWLCFYPSLDSSLGWFYWFAATTTNPPPMQFIDPTDYWGEGCTSWTPWPNIQPEVYDAAFRLDGAVALPPPNVKYLHSEGGWMNITDPVGTQWNELYPLFGREYHLSSWNDTGGDGLLSHSDKIDMYQKPNGEPRDYHVENVTITLYLTPQGDLIEPPPKPMYIELEGGFNATLHWLDYLQLVPIGTQWQEIYPHFCTTYNLTRWYDNGTLILDHRDGITLQNKSTNVTANWTVEDVAVDIAVTPEPGPVGGEAYPVDKISLLAPWIALGVVLAGGTSWYALKRRRAQS